MENYDFILGMRKALHSGIVEEKCSTAFWECGSKVQCCIVGKREIMAALNYGKMGEKYTITQRRINESCNYNVPLTGKGNHREKGK